MKPRAILAAFLLVTAGTTLPVAAQAQPSWQGRDNTWNHDNFWRGAPEGLQQRIQWLQQRIERGTADGSLSREEARRAQWQLNTLRRDADALDRRLDDLSRSLRWSRRDDRYGRDDRFGYNRGGNRESYSTEYDAARYYRDDPRYQERRLGPDDEVYRGSDGRYYCKRSDGTTGLVIGAIGGAAIGNVIDGGHNRIAGMLIGGTIGALIGRSVDQSSDVRCR